MRQDTDNYGIVRGDRKTIETMSGTCDIVRVETEDVNGRWNDSYAVRDGFFVVHEGKRHLVYKLRREKDIRLVLPNGEHKTGRVVLPEKRTRKLPEYAEFPKCYCSEEKCYPLTDGKLTWCGKCGGMIA